MISSLHAGWLHSQSIGMREPVDPADRLPGLHRLGRVDERLEDPRLRREEVVADVAAVEDRRRRLAPYHRAVEDAGVAKHVREAAFRETVDGGRHVPAAA